MSLHDKYEDNLRDAQAFEDFVSDTLFDHAAFALHTYRSPVYQRLKGESRPGLEVKYDRRFRDTGNLYIETEERWNTEVKFRPAGICKEGTTWYVIGDYGKFWLFAVTTLRNCQPHCKSPKDTPTAKGFLLTIDKADKWAAWIFDSEKIDKQAQAAS